LSFVTLQIFFLCSNSYITHKLKFKKVKKDYSPLKILCAYHFKFSNDSLSEISDPTETTFPHVLPLLSLLERSVVTLDESESWESADTGVAMVLSHLNAARTIACNGRIFSANAEAKLQGNAL